MRTSAAFLILSLSRVISFFHVWHYPTSPGAIGVRVSLTEEFCRLGGQTVGEAWRRGAKARRIHGRDDAKDRVGTEGAKFANNVLMV